MRAALALGLLLASGLVLPEPQYFRYQRSVLTPAQGGQTCVALTTDLFAHAASGLADLRLYRDSTEVPYAIHQAAPARLNDALISPINLGMRNGRVVFDATMPAGTYADVELSLNGQNFLATAEVSGRENAASPLTSLGSYTVFDFTREKLGRSTVLHLPSSTFPSLHIEINGKLKPEDVAGLQVLSQASPDLKYVEVARATTFVRKGRSSVAEIQVPANVPVDRVNFQIGAEPAAFSRNVTLTIAPRAPALPEDGSEPPSAITLGGSLLRLHRVQEGVHVDEERLAIESAEHFGTPSSWTLAIDNGDDAPLPVTSVRLQMAERDLCFQASASANYRLLYGDATLSAPHYDYADLFAPEASATPASLAPEQNNPGFQLRPDDRPFTERHPALLWTGLIAVLALLGWLALRSRPATSP